MKKSNMGQNETFKLKLTKFELTHIRDLMRISLPPDGKTTVSQALATLEKRSTIESFLWRKLAKVCQEANIEIDGSADFVVAPSSIPPMGVFQLANEDLKIKGD